MNLRVILRIALRAIFRNKFRSILTMLGIIIGVGSVVAMVSIGQGARSAITAQISSLGTRVLMVMPGSTTQGGIRTGGGSTNTLTPEDARAIAREVSAIDAVSPSVRTVAQVVFQNQNWSTAVYGVGPDFEFIRNWHTVSGVYFTRGDVESASKVCVLGKIVADNLFGSLDPIGHTIRIKRIPFTVIGVLEEKGQAAMGGSGDQDDTILVPYTTAQKRLMGITHLTMVFTSAKEDQLVSQAKEQIEALLRERHHIQEGADDDFTVRSQAEIAQAAQTATGVMIMFLGSVAAISLLVGGIGIMNIMLVSVTERTREIGIRMAVGAQESDILLQFLVEAVLLCVVGGGIGLLLGMGGSAMVGKLLNWPAAITPGILLLAFSFSAGVGIFFGFYPARRASRLDPIEALRYE